VIFVFATKRSSPMSILYTQTLNSRSIIAKVMPASIRRMKLALVDTQNATFVELDSIVLMSFLLIVEINMNSALFVSVME
jgi:hypothetical protein